MKWKSLFGLLSSASDFVVDVIFRNSLSFQCKVQETDNVID